MIPKNYRAWDNKTKSIRDVLVIDWLNGLVDLEGGIIERDFEEIQLMQSTGLKDKNGVESWEGNYLVKDGYWPFFIGWIESEGCLMAVPVNSVQRTNWKPVSVKEKLDFGYVNEGNIYENPEFLEDRDE